MFVGVIISVMYKFFGHIHSVMLIRSNDLPSSFKKKKFLGGKSAFKSIAAVSSRQEEKGLYIAVLGVWLRPLLKDQCGQLVCMLTTTR